ncbi:uncharacterized protein N7503_003303 [Penicillium pulvis]|uniref:uncharacterized protein n=1 Tax=Penicillium pulvis TaxID=1562058 RepID=UPI002549C03D|nr:uncharacterized protein N7503_003303 [Penicillium pulvis]KAJ5805701.1 hypothetical protein N7503_003303 [Penicillium pulvis]
MTNSFPYNTYFVTEEDLQYVPPYMKDTGETPQELKCPIKGCWPKWLAGEFVRVGGSKFVVPLSEDGSKPAAVLQHFFDGLGSLHRFRFADGQVHYTSRSNTDGVARNAKRDGIVRTHMFGPNANTPLRDAQDPCSKLLGESILVHTDYNYLQVCDSKTLEPKRLLTYADIDPQLSGFRICAHPPKDRKRGLTFNYIISEEGKMSVFALSYTSKPASLVWNTVLPCQPCYIHSLAITDKYVIFIRNPLHMDVSDMGKPVMDMLEFEPESKTLFFVLDKEDGKLVRTFAAPNFMFFHSVNGYDYVCPKTGRTNIHVDLCSYDCDYCPYREYTLSNTLDPVRPFQEGTLVRYELAGVDGEMSSKDHTGRATIAQAFRNFPMELPRINKGYSTNPSYRYVYATGGNGGPSPGTLVPVGRLGKNLKCVQGAFFSRIAKADWQTGKTQVWQPEDGESCPCEPVFIARPGAVEEDDGIVLTIIVNRDGTQSILIALDGRTMKEVARAMMPQVYGLGPHGSFIEQKSMYP